MSYDVLIYDKDDNKLQIPYRDLPRGGTYLMQIGIDWDEEVDFQLNITYNYSAYFKRVLGGDGIRNFNNMSIPKVIPRLESAVWALGTTRTSDYWERTPGNAGAALNDLLTVCQRIPNPEDYRMEVLF